MSAAETKDQSEQDDLNSHPLRQFLTYRMSKVQIKLNAQATRILKEASGITLTQWRIIALTGTSGQTRLSDLVKIAALDKSLLSRNVKTLCQEGVLIATPDDHDHRVQILKLSEKGWEVFNKTLPATQARQAKLKANLSHEEIEVFRRVLDKLELAAEE